MALLLAMFQKMRLIREINQETLNVMRYTSKYNRITKNIANVEKMYEGRMNKLDQMAQNFKRQGSIFFQNMFNIGANSTSPFNYSGMNAFVYNSMYSLLGKENKDIKITKDGIEQYFKGMDKDRIKQMLDEYTNNNGFIPKLGEDGKAIPGQYKNNYTELELQAFNQAMRAGQMQQSNNQMQCQQFTQQYQENISIWLDAEKAQIEAEQDEALGALKYEQSMLELDKNASETRLKQLETQKQSYDQLVDEEAKNSAPKFGLG